MYSNPQMEAYQQFMTHPILNQLISIQTLVFRSGRFLMAIFLQNLMTEHSFSKKIIMN